MKHYAWREKSWVRWSRLAGVAVIGISLATLSVFAQQPVDDPLFKKLTGSWHAEGEITILESGDVITVVEDWKGKFDDQGRLVMEGTRKLNDDEHTFRWVYFYNDSSELYEALYSDSNSDEERSWQVSLMEAQSQIEVQAPLGDDATLTLLRTIKDGSFEAKVTITDASGTETASGNVTHTREGDDKAKAEGSGKGKGKGKREAKAKADEN